MADKETPEEKIVGMESALDMLRGCAIMLIFLSKHQHMTTDEEKISLLAEHLKETGSEMSNELYKQMSYEIYRQHSNFSTRFTDSPEDFVSRRDKIVLRAIEMHLEKAQN